MRLCVLRAPAAGPVRGLVVHAPALAEEMNKSRRMVALQSRSFAAQGYAVLQIDLLGCGDSAGDFGDASWDAWVADIVAAAAWLRAEQPRRWPATAGSACAAQPPLWLWGLRAGCLLACAAAERITEPCDLLFWQPTASGKTVLQQFLRLKTMGAMLGGQDAGGAAATRAELAAGRHVDVAGYRLSPALASGLEAAVLKPPGLQASSVSSMPPMRPGRIEWLETTTREPAALSPAAATQLQAWESAGWSA
ncbi:MAG: hydrolase 2, exosortase A system-associated, partial [Microbacteriaceae bacterium]|nr:hydrolase 2, exosortase A system-associated [Burkholderiaceae bacterium]